MASKAAKQQHNKTLHPTAYSFVRSSLRFQQRVNLVVVLRRHTLLRAILHNAVITMTQPSDISESKTGVRLNVVSFLAALGVSIWYFVFVQDDYFFYGKMVAYTIIFSLGAIPLFVSREYSRKTKEAVFMGLLGIVLGGWFGCGIFYARWQVGRMYHTGNFSYPSVTQEK